MTSYTVDFTNIPVSERQAAVLDECKKFLGKEGFAALEIAILKYLDSARKVNMSPRLSRTYLFIGMEMAGIRGFAAREFIHHTIAQRKAADAVIH